MWPDIYNSSLTAYDLMVRPFYVMKLDHTFWLTSSLIKAGRFVGSVQGLWVNVSLAKTARHEAFTWAKGANKLQRLLKVGGVLPITITWKPAHMLALNQVIQSNHFKLLLTLTLLCTVLTNSADVQLTYCTITDNTYTPLFQKKVVIIIL